MAAHPCKPTGSRLGWYRFESGKRTQHHPPHLTEGITIRKIIAAITAAIALVFGGIVTAAPAQANWGTEVKLVNSIPTPHGWIKARNMNGADTIIHVDETATNVAKFCPPSTGWQMWVTLPNDAGVRYTDPGQCFVPGAATSASDPYLVAVVHADYVEWDD